MFNRKNCVICGNNLSEVFYLKNMPVYMGANEGKEEFFSDMTFLKCDNCGTPQIKEILDSNLVYMSNHNKSVIGETWTSHFQELSDFTKPFIQNKIVLEIGDPSFKVSSKLSKLSNKWYIIEPNPDDTNPPENTFLIKGYFNQKTEIDEKIDVIFHSHLLEHLTKPSDDLELFHNKLSDNGKLIFSVPNLENILESKQPVNNILNFEHTYYFNKESMRLFLLSHGFEVETEQPFRSHSIFFVCKKTNKINKFYKFNNIETKLLESLDKFRIWVKEINKIIEKEKIVYLYGCHISTQFILNLGLKTNNIRNILDNSKSKQGYNLYGTKIKTISPEKISEDLEPVVIVNHMSIYSEEIKKQLYEINPNVKIL